MTVLRMILGVLVGVLVCYLFGALLAWDVNPGHWGYILRLWCVCWAVVWGLCGAIIGGQN